MRYSSLGVALICAMFVIPVSRGIARNSPALGTFVHAAFWQEPAPEETVRPQEYRWDTILLRHADAATISASLGGVVGPTQVMPKDIERSIGLGGVDLSAPAMANIVPDGIQSITAIQGTNKLLVRGTRDDITELRELIAYFDTPQRTYRLTMWTDTQTMSMSVHERETAHFEDRTPTRRLEVDISARATESGAIVIRLDGTSSAGQRQCSFSSTTSVKPGIKSRALEFDSPYGRSSIYLRVELDP